jgi:hypothetical protein
VPELQRPQAVDRERLSVGASKLAAVLELSRGRFSVGVDVPIAEVANEEIAAEASEVRRSEGKPPLSQQRTLGGSGEP